jgi:hypothetical protein
MVEVPEPGALIGRSGFRADSGLFLSFGLFSARVSRKGGAAR